MKAKGIELVSVTKTLGKKEDTREDEEQNTEKKKQSLGNAEADPNLKENYWIKIFLCS